MFKSTAQMFKSDRIWAIAFCATTLPATLRTM